MKKTYIISSALIVLIFLGVVFFYFYNANIKSTEYLEGGIRCAYYEKTLSSLENQDEYDYKVYFVNEAGKARLIREFQNKTYFENFVPYINNSILMTSGYVFDLYGNEVESLFIPYLDDLFESSAIISPKETLFAYVVNKTVYPNETGSEINVYTIVNFVNSDKEIKILPTVFSEYNSTYDHVFPLGITSTEDKIVVFATALGLGGDYSNDGGIYFVDIESLSVEEIISTPQTKQGISEFIFPETYYPELDIIILARVIPEVSISLEQLNVSTGELKTIKTFNQEEKLPFSKEYSFSRILSPDGMIIAHNKLINGFNFINMETGKQVGKIYDSGSFITWINQDHWFIYRAMDEVGKNMYLANLDSGQEYQLFDSSVDAEFIGCFN